MPNQTTTDNPPRIIELAREVAGMLDDAYAHRTDFDDCSDCMDLIEDGPRRIRTIEGPDPLCPDHSQDLALAERWEQAVREIQAEAEWAARDAAALDELATIVRTATACASAGELLSRVASVLLQAGRQVSPTTD